MGYPSNRIYRTIKFETPGQIIGHLSYLRENYTGYEFNGGGDQLDQYMLAEIKSLFGTAAWTLEELIGYNDIQVFKDQTYFYPHNHLFAFLFECLGRTITVKLNFNFAILGNEKKEIEESIPKELLVTVPVHSFNLLNTIESIP